MSGMNDISREKIKTIIAVISSIIAVLLIAVMLTVLSTGADEESIEGTGINAAKPYNLPELNEVSLSQQPALYDFLNGSLGLNESLVPMTGYNDLFIFAIRDDSDKLYCAIRHGAGGDISIKLFLPVFTSEPIPIDLDPIEINDFKSDINTLVETGDVTSLVEGDYTFYVVPCTIFLDDTLTMIDFNSLISQRKPSAIEKQIDAGMGIPTEIIREYCDLQAIKEVSSIDFNDPFWDNVNYDSRIKVHKKDGSSEYCIITPIHQKLVAGYGEPLYMFAVNGTSLNKTVDNLDQYLIENGYESIADALASCDYATAEEYEEKVGYAIG